MPSYTWSHLVTPPRTSLSCPVSSCRPLIFYNISLSTAQGTWFPFSYIIAAILDLPAFILFSTTKVLFHFVTLSSVPTLFGLPTLPTLLLLSHQLIATRINWNFLVSVSFLKSFLNICLFSAFTDFPCVPSLSILDSHIDFPV